MPLKILELIRSCKGCPNRRYYSGGQHECSAVGEMIRDEGIIPAFCPLPDFPSGRLAELEHTVRLLREPHTQSLVYDILTHVAVKLKTTVSDRGVVTLKVGKGEPIGLHYDYITLVDPMKAGLIEFRYGERKFQLYSDAQPPKLLEERTVPGHGEALWTEVALA